MKINIDETISSVEYVLGNLGVLSLKSLNDAKIVGKAIALLSTFKAALIEEKKEK